MKERLSFTLDKATLKVVEKLLKSGMYRNKSHVIEMAIKKLGEQEAKNG